MNNYAGNDYEKNGSLAIFFLLMSTSFAILNASSLDKQSRTYHDMVEGRYYFSDGFNPLNGYAYASLTNHDDVYGDNYLGDGQIILERVDNGDNACVASALAVAPNESVVCSKTSLPNNVQYHAKAVWEVVHGPKGSIWSSVE